MLKLGSHQIIFRTVLQDRMLGPPCLGFKESSFMLVSHLLAALALRLSSAQPLWHLPLMAPELRGPQAHTRASLAYCHSAQRQFFRGGFSSGTLLSNSLCFTLQIPQPCCRYAPHSSSLPWSHVVCEASGGGGREQCGL